MQARESYGIEDVGVEDVNMHAWWIFLVLHTIIPIALAQKPELTLGIVGNNGSDAAVATGSSLHVKRDLVLK